MSTVQKGIAYFQNHGLTATLHRIFVNDYAVFSKLPPEKYEEALKKWYKRKTGEVLDLDNPRTYNEKIQWLKLYDSTPLKTRLADKYLVRDWVKEKIGEKYLIPLLGVWDDFDEIDFNQLPNQFVLKANHGSGWNIIVKDKSKFDKNDARKKFKKLMNLNFAFSAGLELHYMNIPPKIIAEQYIEELNGGLYDYKIHCFHGMPVFIQCIGDRNFENHTGFQMNYDINWDPMDWIFEDYPAFLYAVPKPECISEMLRVAKVLSAGFPYVRVDLYEISGNVFFSEMTFTSASGIYQYKRTWTKEKNKELGDMIQLPGKSPVPKRSQG